MLAKLRTIVEDPRTERVIMTLIIINAITLGLQTSKTMMAAFGPILELFDDIIVWVFVVEVTSRIIVHRWAFFKDPWSIFDFIVVAISIVPAEPDLQRAAGAAHPAGAAADHGRAVAEGAWSAGCSPRCPAWARS